MLQLLVEKRSYDKCDFEMCGRIQMLKSSQKRLTTFKQLLYAQHPYIRLLLDGVGIHIANRTHPSCECRSERCKMHDMSFRYDVGRVWR